MLIVGHIFFQFLPILRPAALHWYPPCVPRLGRGIEQRASVENARGVSMEQRLYTQSAWGVLLVFVCWIFLGFCWLLAGHVVAIQLLHKWFYALHVAVKHVRLSSWVCICHFSHICTQDALVQCTGGFRTVFVWDLGGHVQSNAWRGLVIPFVTFSCFACVKKMMSPRPVVPQFFVW